MSIREGAGYWPKQHEHKVSGGNKMATQRRTSTTGIHVEANSDDKPIKQ